MKDTLAEIEDVLHPKRWYKIVGFLILLALVGLAIHVASKEISNELHEAEVASYTPTKFSDLLGEITGLEPQIQAAEEAYQRADREHNELTFSRQDVRSELHRLNQSLVDLQRKRSELIARYNTAARAAKQGNPAALQEMPSHIDDIPQLYTRGWLQNSMEEMAALNEQIEAADEDVAAHEEKMRGRWTSIWKGSDEKKLKQLLNNLRALVARGHTLAEEYRKAKAQIPSQKVKDLPSDLSMIAPVTTLVEAGK